MATEETAFRMGLQPLQGKLLVIRQPARTEPREFSVAGPLVFMAAKVREVCTGFIGLAFSAILQLQVGHPLQFNTYGSQSHEMEVDVKLLERLGHLLGRDWGRHFLQAGVQALALG